MKVKIRKIVNANYIYLNQNPASGYLFYNKSTEQVTTFDLEFNHIGTIELGFKPRFPCSIHPEKAIFLVISEKQWLGLFDFSGNKVKEFIGDYAGAAFGSDGNLWTFERAGHQLLKSKIYDENWELLTIFDLDDSLYDSHLFLTAIPKSKNMMLELAAGQDGSTILLLTHKNGNISVEEPFPKKCLSRPEFNKDGTRFLSLEFDDRVLYLYSFPQFEELGKFEYDFESEICGTTFYVNSELAIISYDYRYFLLNTDTMKIVKELIIEGHEPVATEKIFTRLSGDKSLITDIQSMMVVGDKVFASLLSKTENKTLVFNRNDFAKD